MDTKLLTREQARKEFDRRGLSIKEWARAHGLSERIVYGVLRGDKKGIRGQAHKAAVLLKIKDGVLE